MAPDKAKKPSKGPSSKAAAMPEFNESALASLTAKIDKSLNKPKETSSPAGKKSKETSSPAAKKSKDTSSPAGKRKRDEPEPRAQSHKKRNTRPDGPSSKGNDKAPVSRKDKEAMLREEIKALGGDDADFDLVAGIDSDAEEGQGGQGPDKPVDDKLKNELAKFAASLGFDEVREAAIAEESEAEEDMPDQPSAGEADEDMEGDEDDRMEEDEEEHPEAVAEEDSASEAEEKPQRGKGKMGSLKSEPRADWHGVSQERLPPPASEDISKLMPAINSLKAHAKTLLDADADAYRGIVSASSTHKFMSTNMSSGTMSDKVSALTLAVQESPVHNIRTLENLIGLAGKKSRGQAIAALGALVDLLGNGVVLPNDRRLRPFHAQPGLIGALQKHAIFTWSVGDKLPKRVKEAHLIMWAFEDWLKDAYFRILQLLEVWIGDEIEYSRSRSLDFVFGLLRDKPEQEANLLRLLVNKLGDREKKIASRASYLILQLLTTHPGMKDVAIRTIEQEILLRPGQSIRTKYYAINTLNQTILSNKEAPIADLLVRIYFELFLVLLKSGALGAIDMSGKGKGETKHIQDKAQSKRQQERKEVAAGNEKETAEKLVSAVLSGINRAIPFSLTDESTLEKHLDTLFRITHSSNFNTSIQALMLVQQIATTKHLAVERFYRTLYESLLDPRLMTSSKQALYLNLLFRSLKNDVDVRRVKAFVKRMIQIATLHQPSFACGILFLVFELEATFPDIKTLVTDPEDNEGDEEEVYKDVPEEGAPEVDADGVNGDEASSKANPLAYDGRKRHPESSNAHLSCLWELIPFLSHFHPAVTAFASNLIVRQQSLPKPDLANHTLMHFLDKFVYRNPKAADTKRGSSIMQPVLGGGSAPHAVAPGKADARHQPSVNTAAFWNKKVADVAAEDVFFHEYFAQIGKPGQADKKAKGKKKAAGEDDEGATDSEAEDEIWQALKDSRPEVQGDEDADADMDMDDDSDLASLLNMSDSGDEDEEDEDGGADLDEDEGDEAGSDGGVEFFDFSEDEAEEEQTRKKVGPPAAPKDGKRMDRKALKALPMFASADDYEALLNNEEDNDF